MFAQDRVPLFELYYHSLGLVPSTDTPELDQKILQRDHITAVVKLKEWFLTLMKKMVVVIHL